MTGLEMRADPSDEYSREMIAASERAVSAVIETTGALVDAAVRAVIENQVNGGGGGEDERDDD